MRGLMPLGASQGPRNVDTQFTLDRGHLSVATKALYRAVCKDIRTGPALAA